MVTRSKSRTGWIMGIVAVALITVVSVGAWQMRGSADAKSDSGSLTQDPSLYQGDTRQAYQVAREHPELLAQFDCYCGCEQNEGHKSLLDCFRTNHGAGCDICVGEAVTAGQMFSKGTPVDQIREALRARYGHGG